MKQFNLKTNPWYIVTKNAEDNAAAQRWLFAQGVSWCNGESEVSNSGLILVNYHNMRNYAIDINNEGFMHTDDCDTLRRLGPQFELKLKFSVEVNDVLSYPETDIDRKIKSLEETIKNAQAEIDKLKLEN